MAEKRVFECDSCRRAYVPRDEDDLPAGWHLACRRVRAAGGPHNRKREDRTDWVAWVCSKECFIRLATYGLSHVEARAISRGN
jgi:hypothetical protein